MKRTLATLTSVLLLAHCSSSDARPTSTEGGDATGGASGGASSGGKSGASGGIANSGGGTGAGASTAGGAGNAGNGSGGIVGGSGNTPGSGGSVPGTGGQRPYPDAHDPNDSPPKIGEAGCGFPIAAFCDTFGAPSVVRGRGGELDTVFWSGSRMSGERSTTRAMAIGMSVIPQCRPDVTEHVWPPNDVLICQPTVDAESHHLLIAAAAQHYGQNGYRIRQPFDFANRTGKIVFDASAEPLGNVFGWISLAVTEDPISMPGYAIFGNDEGSVLPKNAVEVHFSGSDNDLVLRNVHVFKNFADTVYEPPQSTPHAPKKLGKLNHFEIDVSATSIAVRVSPFSENGVTFGAPVITYQQAISLPFTRGWVHLSLHNHATIKYSQPGSYPRIVDASVARVDNVGFDGPVITNWREYEVPDSLVEFKDPSAFPYPDPYNPQGEGVDIGYFVADAAQAPLTKHTIKGVKLDRVVKARVVTSFWSNFLDAGGDAANFVLRARVNGKAWRERKFTADEARLQKPGPTTTNASGAPIGAPASQGRVALMIDVPLEDLVSGDNTLEFTTANVPTGTPPLVCNTDLVLTLD